MYPSKWCSYRFLVRAVVGKATRLRQCPQPISKTREPWGEFLIYLNISTEMLMNEKLPNQVGKSFQRKIVQMAALQNLPNAIQTL